ncbi:Smr/MutS family protein [Algoriphagus sediminis]|uniref:Smr/MutS family protein n=1 Tax=Algoriphagus sediminis TaxID=3057113 RepID=A0ABT7Y8Q0_9BACT|nr:Smr/MutS family protein [Algoriphagus sediminis]MDN3202891.1 Smr/MutS family protein [Algoriphagus sediminis]
MKIGDKVRMLHGNEEGTIRKVSGSRVEIEIEDGFLIPAMKNELVVIHSSEKTFFEESTKTVPENNEESNQDSDQAPLIAMIPQNDQEMILHLVNPSLGSFLVHVEAEKEGLVKTLFANQLPKKQWAQLDRFKLKDLSSWPILNVLILPIHESFENKGPIISSTLKFKAKVFSKSTVEIPLLKQKGYLFEIFREEKELDIHSLNAELNEWNPTATQQVKPPSSRVDLHIEELVEKPDELSNSEMLRIQLETFEQNLNQAISSGLDEITFVHGIGNGVLRKEIHKRLSEIKNIKYFKDTQKDRWGYGATLVRIS